MKEKSIVFNLFDDDIFQKNICNQLKFEKGKLTIHDFPDEEILITIDNKVLDKNVIFILSTDRPNDKIIKLLFAAETARELGAKKIGFIAPYLAYMRQDVQFHQGEGITSKYFAKLISHYFDWLITIDPHLHRWHFLSEIFSIPAVVLHATMNIANWIKSQIKNPVLIGPDEESRQWVSEIAKAVDAPFLIVEKQRFNDTTVKSSVPQIEKYINHTAVVIDDIISTASTMIETVNHIKQQGMKSIYCIGVHAIFSNHSYQDLLATNIKEIVTCNTILHPSNKIDLSNIIVEAVAAISQT